MQKFNYELEQLSAVEPYSMEAEQSVLGAALLDSETVLSDLMIVLNENMFYAKENSGIFAEMSRLFTAGIRVDFVTLLDAVVSAGVFESPDAAKIYLTRIVDTTPSISNVDAYAKIVKEKYTARQVMGTARSILQQGSEHGDADMLLENAEQQLFQIRSGQEQNALIPFSVAVVEGISQLEKLSESKDGSQKSVPTGYTYLDSILTGMGRSDLIILAARPGMGKTSFALNIATNVAKKQNIPVAVFSLEMSCEQLTNRILSSEAGVDSHAFRTGVMSQSEWDDLAHATDMLHQMPMYLDDTSSITIPEMKAKIRRVNQDPTKEKIGLIIIDYLQLMSSGKRSENRVQEISEITRNLKIMAKELNVPVVALSQLSRAAEKSGRTDRRPQLSDLRDSGSIEQDADIVLFLYREAYYSSIGGESVEETDSSTAECIIAKNRHGETGKVDLGWDGAHTRFIDLDYRRG